MVNPPDPGGHTTYRAALRGSVAAMLLSILILPSGTAAAMQTSDPRAEASFREIEGQLRSEKSLRFKFEIRSSGPVTASLQGQVRFKSGNRVELDVSGTYGSEPVNARLESDGKKLSLTVGTLKYDRETPRALNDALVVGFTRMGLYYNLFSLLEGKPPAHADGTVEEWAQVSDFRFAAPDPSSKVRGRSIRFSVTVAGEDFAEADYWISPLVRIPVERKQTVHLPQGDLEVVESYEFPD
jgi:hypothetical protein